MRWWHVDRKADSADGLQTLGLLHALVLTRQHAIRSGFNNNPESQEQFTINSVLELDLRDLDNVETKALIDQNQDESSELIRTT